LIDVLLEHAEREEAHLERIREAYLRHDTAEVMKLVGEFFSLPPPASTSSGTSSKQKNKD